MKVLDAVEQARLARQLLASVDELPADQIRQSSQVLEDFLQNRNSNASEIISHRNLLYNVADSFHPVILTHEYEFHPQLESYIDGLSKVVLEFSGILNQSVDIIDHALLNPSDQFKRSSIIKIREIHTFLSSIQREKSLLLAFIHAWETFDTPNEWEPHSHSIVFYTLEENTTIEAWKDITSGIDGIFVGLLILEDRIDLIDDIHLERIEAGSFGVSLKDIPTPAWTHIFEALLRALNKRAVDIDNRKRETELVMLTSDAFAKLNLQLQSGEINEDVHRVLTARLAETHRLPLDAFILKVDGKAIATDHSEPAGVQAPRQTLALPSGTPPETASEPSEQGD